MDRIIRLADGTEFPLIMCGVSNGVLWIEITGNMVDAFAAFSDPGKVSVLIDTYEGHEDLRRVVWEGFDNICYISNFETEGNIRIGMKTGVN